MQSNQKSSGKPSQQGEQAIQEFYKHARHFLEIVHEPLVVLNADLRVVWANASFCQTFKASSADIEGKLLYELGNCPWDILRLRQFLEQLLSRKDPVDNIVMEQDLETLGRQTVSLNVRRICSGANSTHLIFLAVQDVTERNYAESALLLQQEYYRSLIENSQDAIIILDGSGAVRYASSSYHRILGYEPTDQVRNRWFEFVHPDDIAKANSAFAQLTQNAGSQVHAEVRARHKDGSWHTIEIVGNNLLSDPAVGGIVVNFIDITERRKAEAELARYHHHLQELVEERTRELTNTNEKLRREILDRKRAEVELRIKDIAIASSLNAIAFGNLEGHVQYVNNSFLKMWGYDSNDEVVGKPYTEFWRYPEQAAEVVVTLQEKGSWQGEAIALRKAGSTFDVLVSSSVVKDEAGKPVCLMASFIDITERKDAEAKLEGLYKQERDLREQLEAEMKRRVEFTRALAHELKTPLTSVQASSELLVSELHDEPMLRLAKSINRSASNLDKRIDELLDLARSEIGMLQLKLEKVDVTQLLRDVADDMSPVAASRQQSLVLELPSFLPMVQADCARLHQVVTNLLSNAFKFTPKGGCVTLRAAEEKTTLVIEVQDTGRGISHDEQSRLFNPYHRIESDREHFSGLGLGLALCKTVVELHGGQIWVKSQLGKGSTFSFSLPLTGISQQRAEQTKESKTWEVLIIEDDPEIVESISVAFALRWPEARLVSTDLGEEAVKLVENRTIDIVILDLGLPDISGYEVLRQIRLFSSIPVLIVTVRGGEEDIVKGLELGADDYIVKPFKQSELLARLKVQLRKHTPINGETPFFCGSWRYDPSTLKFLDGDKEVSLSVVEHRIIQCLMKNAGQIVSYSQLAEAIWGDNYPGCVESLRVHIRRLREKIEEEPSNPRLIVTRPNIGYSLVRIPEAQSRGITKGIIKTS
jgi:PAS domain S-box-containing protein